MCCLHSKLCQLTKIKFKKIVGPESRLPTASLYLKSITVYPIKSCAGFTVESWPLSSTGSYLPSSHFHGLCKFKFFGWVGASKVDLQIEFYSFFCDFRAGLLHDREWVLTSPSGEILTQKKVKVVSDAEVVLHACAHVQTQLYGETWCISIYFHISISHFKLFKSTLLKQPCLIHGGHI